MKRTPLRRKTPLKKGISQLKKIPLNKTSKSLKKKLQQYQKCIPPEVAQCVRCGLANTLEKHHPYGRGKNFLYQWIYLCHDCHHWVHHVSPNAAYELGYLQPEYRGYNTNPNHPKPWTTNQISKCN